MWSLLRSGLVTNDRYDLLRRGEPPHDEQAPPLRSRGQLRAFLRDSRRRQTAAWPEGRWSLLAWGQPDPETAAFFHARLLLNRFGIVARELANMSGITTPWRILYEILSRLELSGEVRRGYFVEGLSGAQFALPDAAALLHENALPSHAQAPVLLLHSLDPANLYGSGAALELMVPSDEACHAHARPGLATGPAEALRGHATPFQCRANNWLVMKAGRPLLLIELQGKRLTAMPQATTDDLAKAAARLPDLLKLAPNRDARHKLRVETWNDQPVAGTPGRHLLEQVGFVRDYQAMTLYAVWQT